MKAFMINLYNKEDDYSEKNLQWRTKLMSRAYVMMNCDLGEEKTIIKSLENTAANKDRFLSFSF